MNTKIIFMLLAATLFLKGDSHSAASSRLFGWGSARVAPEGSSEPDPESGLPTSTDEIRKPEEAGAAIAALPAPPEVRPEIWKPKQIKDELKRVFITDEPHADSEFFKKTIQDISAHVVLSEARFRSLFTDLSKELEGDFYTHLYGAHPFFSSENVKLMVGPLAGFVISVIGVILREYGQQITTPENSQIIVGMGIGILAGTILIPLCFEATKYGFGRIRNRMHCDYRGWCCGSTGCCRPNSKDVIKAGVLSKFVSILTIALNAEALGAMTDEDAIKAMKGEVTLSLKSHEIDGGEKLSLKEYFLDNSLYLLLT
jgi:hypothetical protein